MELKSILLHITPLATEWATVKCAEILKYGEPLTQKEAALAAQMGVKNVDVIRLQLVDKLPMPDHPDLAKVAITTGLFAPDIVGLTLGHGIYICRGHRTNQLVSHECRHVYQYEQAGSIGNFLNLYLQQIADYGYERAPFELDAYACQKNF